MERREPVSARWRSAISGFGLIAVKKTRILDVIFTQAEDYRFRHAGIGPMVHSVSPADSIFLSFSLRGMTMNAQRTRLLRQSIDEEQRNLEEAMKSVITQPCADDNEMASCHESAHANISLMQHARKRLLHLRQRMTVLESRPHALCIDCGDAISPQRLSAVPDAMRCAGCQEDWEEGHKLGHLWENTDGTFPYYV